jgi:thiamine transporter
MSKRSTVVVLAEGALVAALAIVLSLLPTNFGPGGGFSISLGMIPMTIYALRRGLKPALVASFLWGVMHFPLGQVYFLSLPQVAIEYFLAFTFAGFAGLYHQQVQTALERGQLRIAMRYAALARFVGAGGRWFWHFIAGVVFWGSYAMWGYGPILYSLIVNGISGLVTGAVTAFVVTLLLTRTPRLFTPNK